MSYDPMQENLEKLERFPTIDAAYYTRRINALFPAYVFIKRSRKDIAIWSSCCGEHRVEPLTKRTMTDLDYALRSAKHNEEGWCPFCGMPATIKEAGRLGKRKNLVKYIPAVILSASEGDLYARACWCRKTYQGDLTERPEVYMPSVYRFSAREHLAEQIIYPEDECICRQQKDKYRVKALAITEPFTTGGYCCESYCAYHVLNLEAIGQSDFRYAQYDAFHQKSEFARLGDIHFYLMRFLTVAAIYPNKVEMLIKSGLDGLVDDLVKDRKKHAAWFDWDAQDLKDAFRILDRQQLRQIREIKMKPWEIDQWAKAYQNGVTLAEVHEICRANCDVTELIQITKDRKLRLQDVIRYLRNQEAKKQARTLSAAAYLWRDYMNMAGDLGCPMQPEIEIFPPRLRSRHDAALEEIQARRARLDMEKKLAKVGELDKLLRENKKKMVARRKKYNLEAEGYFIRIAENGEEIIREGATLQHCVGGYAERHIKGATTILFLRRTETPEASLYTIEMDGNILRQIHGYKNDKGRTDPRETMGWFLTPWLQWLREGSPRDKNGAPVVQSERKTDKEVKSA